MLHRGLCHATVTGPYLSTTSMIPPALMLVEKNSAVSFTCKQPGHGIQDLRS